MSLMDALACYELCVQKPEMVVRLLRRAHGGRAMVLREDFCGTARVCRAWVRVFAADGEEAARAIGVDLDPAVLERAKREMVGDEGVNVGVELVCADAVRAPVGDVGACDVIFVGNFSIGYIHERRTLVEYFSRCAERLSAGGVLAVDVFDGPERLSVGAQRRTHVSERGAVVIATWERRRGDVLTGMVECVLHFRVIAGGEVTHEWPEAFVYRWRAWTIAEIREAMREAGFVSSDVYQHPDGPPMQPGEVLGEGGAVVVIGRVAQASR